MKIILMLLLNIFLLLTCPGFSFVDPTFYEQEIQSPEGEFVRNPEDPHFHFAAHFALTYRERSTLLINLEEDGDYMTYYFYLLDGLPKQESRMYLQILNEFCIPIDRFYLVNIFPDSPLGELLEGKLDCRILRLMCERLGMCPKFYRITFEAQY